MHSVCVLGKEKKNTIKKTLKIRTPKQFAVVILKVEQFGIIIE